ncbi:tetraspanin-9-like [Acanthaster planci]|uniref:Tetraspanin n=1 Tax=Acanthaster planci TaxID=133434 RepID=A0A8B7ZVC4_ACAPL|nr:tetraspanin-9-like [Acanthaster planci]XP_022109509.1 tetraspanin-9-like [Acanthaster planci]
MGMRDCAKSVLFIFNLLFFMTGVAVLAIGAFLYSREGPFATLLPSLPFLNVTTMTMIVGCVIMIVAFLGCCGAMKENVCMVSTYFIIMVAILTAELIAGGLGFANRNAVEAFIEKDLTQRGIPLYGTKGEHGLTSAWDRMQTSLSCCGVNNSTDWSRFHPLMTIPGETPDSCCSEHLVTACGRDNDVSKWEKGCKEVLNGEIKSHMGVVAGALIGVGVFQMLGIVLSFMLCYSIRKG